MTLQEAIEIQRDVLFRRATEARRAERFFSADAAIETATMLPCENALSWIEESRAICGVNVHGTVRFTKAHARRACTTALIEAIAEVLR